MDKLTIAEEAYKNGYEKGLKDAVKHGRWISHNKGQNNWVECSECNTVGSPFWKRCPMCEAKMDGGAEDAQRGKEVPAQN